MANTNSPYIAKNAAPLVNPTTATLFQQLPSPIATVASTQVAKPVYTKYACYAQAGAGTSNNINIVRIAVRASGRVTTGASSTFVPALVLFANSGITPPALASSTTAAATLSSATFATNSGNWFIDWSLVWDPNSGYVSGTFSGQQTNGAGTATTTAATGITPISGYTLTAPPSNLPTTPAQNLAVSTAELDLFFGVTGIFGTGNAANTAYLDNFEVEVA